MKIFNATADARRAMRRPIATIGNFDGLHRGHRAIIERVVERSAATGSPSLLITFEPHPLQILAPERAPDMLTTRAQKLALIERAGIDGVLILPFTREFAALPAQRFVQEQLASGLEIREVYVGGNFNFGRSRGGNADLLISLCGSLGIVAEVVPEIRTLSSPVSSSRIRRALRAGEVELAGELLGRPYGVEGTVIRGAGRGAGLGFPTANMTPAAQLIPEDGVYITEVRVDDGTHHSVTNIGSRPTFEDARFTVETHLLDSHEELYDRTIEVRFLARLRPELKFESAEALVQQVQRDIERARRYFSAAPA